MEIQMYYGGGILGTILIVALIVFLVRRSRI
jgi:O-antigen ligase